MSAEHPWPHLTADPAALARELSEAIRAVPGVVDLAPTLTGRALHLGKKLLSRQPPVLGQGIEVHLDETVATVTVDITAETWRPTVATAGQVQNTVHAVLLAHQLTCASITVSVLALRP